METVNVRNDKDLSLAQKIVEKYEAELSAYKKRRIAGIKAADRNKVISDYEETIKLLKDKINEYNGTRNSTGHKIGDNNKNTGTQSEQGVHNANS